MELRRPGEDAVEIIASGVDNQDTAELATFDPTLRKNGLYELMLIAIDAGAHRVEDTTVMVVEGNLKVGNFGFTVEDLNIPLAGVPIQITRTYDSRQKHVVGGFGYGWTIDYQNVDLQESRVPGKDWEINTYASGPLGILTDYCVEPIGSPLVTVTLPDGKVERFTVSAEPHCNTAAAIEDVQLVFTAADGTTSTLEETDVGTVRFFNGNLTDIISNVVADPEQYTLTTHAGYRYYLDQSFGIDKIETPNGHTITYNEAEIKHSLGKKISFGRDSQKRVTTIRDPSGNRINYSYTGGDLTSVTDQLSNITRYTYNDSHDLLEIIDPLGRKLTKNIYDTDGRLIAQEDNLGNRTDFTHDIAGRESIVTDRLGRSTLYYYDDRGNVTTEVDANGGISNYSYDAHDNQLTQTNALGHTTSATYDTRYNQLSDTDALGNTVAFTYNQRGQELTIRDALGHQYSNNYDPYGNLLSITDPLNNSASNTLNVNGMVGSTTDPEGHTTQYDYRARYGFIGSNLQSETDAEGNTLSYDYDVNNNRTRETRTRFVDGQLNTETADTAYDALNRPIRTEHYDGSITETEYDALGNAVAEIDAKGRRTERAYDAYGRLLETTYPDGTTETNTYDAEGNLLTETDRKSRTTSYTYDALNRLTLTTYPDNSATETVYDCSVPDCYHTFSQIIYRTI